MRLLSQPRALPCVPRLYGASANADGAAALGNGRSVYEFPPYIIMERGATLREWLQVRLLPTLPTMQTLRLARLRTAWKCSSREVLRDLHEAVACGTW